MSYGVYVDAFRKYLRFRLLDAYRQAVLMCMCHDAVNVAILLDQLCCSFGANAFGSWHIVNCISGQSQIISELH
jgi:hypothetical protein